MVSRHYFNLFLGIFFTLTLYTSSACHAQSDLMLDMGLDTEETLPDETISQQILPAPANAPVATPPPAPKAPTRPKKNIAAGIDLITRIKNGMDFNTEEVEQWIMAGNDANKCMENGNTLLLYLVAKHTDTEAIRFAIENGADLQTHCTPRHEALFVAIKENPSAPVIETLINNNANIIATDEDGNTALILAAAYNPNPEIIKTLLEFGLKINTKNLFGFDALTLAVYNNNRIPILQAILDNKADINAKDLDGHTPLMAAAVLGNDMVMQYLIRHGADYSAVDNQGISVYDYYNKRDYLKTLPFDSNPYASISEKLHQAYKFIAENHLKYNNALLQSLYQPDVEAALADALEHNADVDILDSKGCTTLLNAVMQGHSAPIISKLINSKANINATCQDEKNALMFIFTPENSSTSLPEQIEKIHLLAEHDINANTADTNGNTALMYAAANQAAPGIIQALIKAGSNVNAVNNAGETALMLAIKQNAPEKSIKMLLNNQADPNIADNGGLTPLWHMINTNADSTLIESVLAHGALVDIPNAEGDTPLLFALKNNYPAATVQALIENGANPKIKDRDGNDAYDILKSSLYFNEAMKQRTREHVLGEWN